MQTAIPADAQLSELKGVDAAISTIQAAVLMALEPPRLPDVVGFSVGAPRGLLLHGPSGVGKTTIAHAVSA